MLGESQFSLCTLGEHQTLSSVPLQPKIHDSSLLSLEASVALVPNYVSKSPLPLPVSGPRKCPFLITSSVMHF